MVDHHVRAGGTMLSEGRHWDAETCILMLKEMRWPAHE